MNGQVAIRVNSGIQKDGTPWKPFVVMDNRWDETGYFSLTLFTTPGQLRQLADQLEEAEKQYDEAMRNKVEVA